MRASPSQRLGRASSTVKRPPLSRILAAAMACMGLGALQWWITGMRRGRYERRRCRASRGE